MDPTITQQVASPNDEQPTSLGATTPNSLHSDLLGKKVLDTLTSVAVTSSISDNAALSKMHSLPMANSLADHQQARLLEGPMRVSYKMVKTPDGDNKRVMNFVYDVNARIQHRQNRSNSFNTKSSNSSPNTDLTSLMSSSSLKDELSFDNDEYHK